MQADPQTPVPGQIQRHTKKGSSPAAWYALTELLIQPY